MSLNFAAISPHPPIIVPGIGSKDDLIKAASIVQSMNKLGFAFNQAEIDTLIVISPHGLIYPDQFNICGMKKLFGSFAEFNAPQIIVENQNNLELARLIDEAAQKEGINSLLYDNNGEFYELDHGVMVPLSYLKSKLENPIKVIPISYSNLDRAAHFSMGQIIRDVAAKYPERVGILASGDLSHQLIQNPETKKFDEKLIDDLKNNRKDILFYDDEMIDNWAECGYRSILILLGALDGMKVKPEILSYEGPFGVGYLVATFKLPEA